MALPDVDSQAKCTFNGQQLNLTLGTLGYNGTELFTVKNVSLECGHVYAIAGPNGVGKSSFAKLITSKTIQGFPETLTTYYLDSLASKLESDLHPVQYLEAQVAERCRTLKDQQEALEQSLEELDEDQVEAIVSRLGLLYDQEQELIATSQSEIATILRDLGFESASLLDRPVKSLSSGWSYKLLLVNALISHPDLLVLDEPSFLDVQSMSFLCQRARAAAETGAIVCIISHKEKLLEDLVDNVLFISAEKVMEVYHCDWSGFKAARGSNVAHAKKEISRSQDERSKNSNSLKSLEARLSKRENKTAKLLSAGKEDKRFIKGRSTEKKQRAMKSVVAKSKLLTKDAEKLKELEGMTRSHEETILHLSGTEWPESQRLVTCQDVSFGYSSETMLLKNASLSIYGKDRIVLSGRNGQGKSTFIKLLLGELEPSSGEVVRSTGVKVAYFPQDALQRLVEQHGEEQCTELVQKVCGLTALEARAHLGRFGLKGRLSLQTVHTLSAGQRTRLVLALEFKPDCSPSLLILDEVENLDKESISSLLNSLSEFEGAVLCVSHDESHIADLKPRQIWHLENGKVEISLTDDL